MLVLLSLVGCTHGTSAERHDGTASAATSRTDATSAANAIDVPLADCVMVDDDIMNVRAAVEHGMIGILHTAFDRTAVEIQSLFGIEGEF